MPDKLSILSENPLSLIRSLPTQLIPTNKIKVREDHIVDEIFLSRYSSFLRGKVPIHYTRVSLNLVRRGFWKRSGSDWTLIEGHFSDKDLADVVSMIRQGNRPALHLYENPNSQDDKRFVCADDAVIHAAYEKLGISKVPAAVMAKPKDLEESSLAIRCYPRGKKGPIALLESVVPVTHHLVPSFLGKNPPDMTSSLGLLIQVLSETKTTIKRFHQSGEATLHYHHTLYSVLRRAEDCVDSMRLLIENGKPLVATGLLRSLHELTLVFYIDWLSPEQTPQYLQMASVQTENEWKASCEKGRLSDIAAGASHIEAKNIKDAHMRSFRLGSVVGERARLFPLGEKFQRGVYSFLSDVIHHDFSMTARYAHTLDQGDEAVFQSDVVKTIVHLSDILVAAIVSRIREDIGALPEKRPSSVLNT